MRESLICLTLINIIPVVDEIYISKYKSYIMPLIEYTSFNMSDELKGKLIRELTKTASEVHNVPVEAFTVIIREVSGPESFGVKGEPLSPR